MKQTHFTLFVLVCVLTLAAARTQAQSVFQYDSNGNLTNVTAAVAGPPSITTPPITQIVYNGDDAAFSVVASGSGPLSYQWLANGALISGATNSTLFLPDVTVSNQNSYSVIVGNTSGSVTSSVPAVLEFNWTWVAAGPADWFSPSSWQPAIVPTGFENITIPAGATVNLSAPVTISGALTCYGGTINSNSLTIAPGASFSVIGGTVNIQCQIFSYQGALELADNAVLNVNGTWVNTGTVNATNSSGGTVNLTGTLVNSNATVILNATSGSWVLNGGTVQGGTITETSTNELLVQGGTLNGVTVNGGVNVGSFASAILTVTNDLTVNGTMLLGNNGTVVGGTVIVTNGASLVVNAGNGTLNGVMLDGVLDVGNSVNAATLTVTNGLTLNGTALVGNPTNSNYGEIGFAGTQSLSGNGTVIFGNNGHYDYNALRVLNGNTTLTIGTGIMVRGQNGAIGDATDYGGSVANVGVVNNGTISADVSGGTILIDALPFVNAGLAQALNGGTLTLENTWSNSGQLNVSASSVLNLNGSFMGASLSGINRTNGTINLPGIVNNTGNTLVLAGAWMLDGGTILNGTVVATNGASLIVDGSGTFNGVTFNGTLDIGRSSPNVALMVTNGLVFNGTAYLGNPTNGGYGSLGFEGSQTMSGNGTVVFGNSAANALWLVYNGTALTLGPDITVEGQNGFLGYDGGYWSAAQNVSITNLGTISADVSGGTILIDALPFVNARLAQALNGGTLTLENTWSNSGQLNVSASSVLNLNGSFMGASLSGINRTNGTINLPGIVNNTGNTLVLAGAWMLDGGTILNGTVVATNGASLIVDGSGTFNGVTFNGTLDVGNTYSGANLTVTNGLTLNGTVLMGNPANGSYGAIDFSGTQTLGGNGTAVFGDSGDNALRVLNGGTTLTLGPGITVRGQYGAIGFASPYGGAANVAVVNQGTISCDVNGGTIVVDAQPFSNQGTIVATLGTVALAGTFNLASGTLEFGLSNTNRFGQINITGNATLGGTVSAILFGGFVPTPTNSFAVLTYGSYSGAFANTELPSSIVWQTNYGSTTFTLVASDIRPALKPLVSASAQFLLQFSGNTNDTYTILASTNLALPFSNWVTLGNASLLSNTLYQFIDTNSTNFHARFYMLRSP